MATRIISVRLGALVHWLLNPGPRLSQRVVHAGFWAFALRMTLRLFTFVRTVILARLLAPDDFGLMGIALLVMSLLETFTSTGFNAALVQRKGDIRPHLDTAWTVSVVRGLVLAGALALSGPFVASFFDAPQASLIVRVMAVSVLVGGFTNVGIVFFQKELEFQKRFLNELLPSLADVAVGIAMALVLRNVWALVYGTLASSAVRVLASYLLHPFRPRVRLEWAKAKEMYGFGRWVFLGNILTFLSLRLDSLAVGKFLGPLSLGLYQMAYRISDAVRTEIASTVQSIAFPALSKVQRELAALRQGFDRMVEAVSCVILPASAVIVVVAGDFTRLVLGEQWLDAVPAVQVIAVVAAVRSIQATSWPLLHGVGQPRLDFQKNVLRMICVAALLYPFIRWWGLMGAAWAVAVATGFSLPFHFVYAARVLRYGPVDLARPLVLPLMLTGVVALFLVAFQATVGTGDVLRLAGAVLASGALYLAAMWLSWRIWGNGPLQIIRQLSKGAFATPGTAAKGATVQ